MRYKKSLELYRLVSRIRKKRQISINHVCLRSFNSFNLSLRPCMTRTLYVERLKLYISWLISIKVNYNNNLDSTVITVLSNLEYKETFNLIESNHTEC